MLRPFRSPRHASHEDVFVERYARLLARAKQITGGDRLAAEDLVHDAFVNFTLSQPDLSAIQSLDGYLFTTLRHVHLSKIRRGKHRAGMGRTLLEYESAVEALQAVDASRVSDELAAICQYACLRRHSSKAGSALILRFFHGYPVSEVARILRTSRNAVDALLKTARREARAWMDDPTQLRFLHRSDVPELRSSAFAHPCATVVDLQAAVFSQVVGFCLPTPDLDAWSRADPPPLECGTLAHVVACRGCLERINAILGLATHRGQGSNDNDEPGSRPPSSSAGGRSIAHGPEIGQQRAREVSSRRPAELRIAVNGIVLCGQRVHGTDVSLHVTVQSTERFGFVEVFDEQDIRLLLLSIDPAPDGAVEQTARARLSEGRELAVAVSFASAWPLVTATYRDPAEPVTRVETTAVSPIEDSPAPSRHEWRLEPRGGWPWRASGWNWWPRPVVVALTIIVIVVLLVGPSDAVSAMVRYGSAVIDAISRFVAGEQAVSENPPASGSPSSSGDVELPRPAVIPPLPSSLPAPSGLSERARLGLEVEVLQRLDRVDALFGESLVLSTRPNGRLALAGVVQNVARREAILAELGVLRHIPQLEVTLRTATEATPVTSAPTELRSVEVVASRAPIRDVLDPLLEAQDVLPGADVEEEARALGGRVLDLSRRTVLHSWALKRVVVQVPEVQIGTGDSSMSRAWYGLLVKHTQQSVALLQTMREELERVRVLTPVDVPSSDVALDVDALSFTDSLARSADARDRIVRALFAASSDQGDVDVPRLLADLSMQIGQGLRLAHDAVDYFSARAQ